VEDGINMSHNSVEAIENISTDILHVASQIDGIVTSKEEEALALSDVTKSTSDINIQTTEIQKAVNESATAGENLLGLANSITEIAAGFSSDKMKEFMPWSEKLETGIDSIDSQHKRLIELLNTLYNAMKDHASREKLLEIFDELLDYTVYHFDYEEELFSKYGYERESEHIKIHEALKRSAIEKRQKFLDGEAIIGFNLISFLEDWVKNHILIEDRKYIEFFKKNSLN